MKKLLLLLLLALVGYGAYFLYNNDENFHRFVTEQLDKLRTPVADTTQVADEPETENQPHKKGHKRIAKTLKPDEWTALDKYARNAPKSYEKDISTLAQYLVKPAKNETEKARLLFTWVATHIKYDDDGYNSGNLGECSAESVFKSRKSVCAGFAGLLAALATAAGLEAENISGYAKGYGYKPGEKFKETNHAWNAIKIDGRWALFDATWAEGAAQTVKGKLVSKAKFDPYWFDVNPKEFIFSHLPDKANWQLNETKIGLSRYESLPFLDEAFFKLRFNSNNVFDDAMHGRVNNFVKTYSLEFPLRAMQMPYNAQLKKGQEVKFIIYAEYAEDIALIENGEWIHFTKDGNVFKLNYTAKGDVISINTKTNWFDKNYSTVAEYTTTGSGPVALN